MRRQLCTVPTGRCSALGLSSAELAERARLTVEEIERIEESGVDPTLELIENLAEALHSGVLIDPRATPVFRFESRAAQRQLVIGAGSGSSRKDRRPPLTRKAAVGPVRFAGRYAANRHRLEVNPRASTRRR
jgi:transcriptional regulator with XRE-family HTH domain